MALFFEMHKSEMCGQFLVFVVDNANVAGILHELHPETGIGCLVSVEVASIKSATQFVMPQHVEPATHSGGSLDESDVSEPDPFDADEEYVGVNDEHLYVVVAPTNPAPSYNVEPFESAPVVVEGGVPSEAEITDTNPNVVSVIHDPDNPVIRKNALFPDMISFRKAIKHYAVKRRI